MVVTRAQIHAISFRVTAVRVDYPDDTQIAPRDPYERLGGLYRCHEPGDPYRTVHIPGSRVSR